MYNINGLHNFNWFKKLSFRLMQQNLLKNHIVMDISLEKIIKSKKN